MIGMILDSAYTNLIQLAEEIIDKGRQNGLFAPNFAVKFAVRFVRSSVLKAANFDIRQVCPIDKADRCFIPALFVAAEHDMFVAKHHRYNEFLRLPQCNALNSATHCVTVESFLFYLSNNTSILVSKSLKCMVETRI